jgi:hypothetical protein
MFCIYLWGFSIDPPYFGYNFAEQENMFCVFLCFKNLPELKLTWDFWALIFYHENLLEYKKSTRETMPVKQDLVAQAQA